MLIRAETCPPVPWKNGAGTTRELWAKTDAQGQPLIRISIAEIAGSQAFSSFPGIDRVILQLDGPAMDLTIDDRVHRLLPHRPLPFAGEARVSCQVTGAGLAHDLNLMCRRDAYHASMDVVPFAAGQGYDLGAETGYSALLALESCTLTAPDTVHLGQHDLLIATGRFHLRCIEAAHVVVMSAQPVVPASDGARSG